MRSERVAAAVLSGALLVAAGCSGPESFIILGLRSSTATPITGVANIRVRVSKGTVKMRTLIYDAGGMTIGQSMEMEKTLSVGFSSAETGNIDFEVDALNDMGCTIGHGTQTQEIRKGNWVKAIVSLAATLNCNNVDGGAPDAPEGGVLPGCDPVNPQSTAAGVTTCTATQTCQVNCAPPMNAPPRNECITGGTGGPGTTCNTNADCMPGTQCFNYASTGCAVKLCLRFCNANPDCVAFGAGGGGPGSVCEGPVQCPSFLTAHHTCTFNCDPRFAMAASRGGCPTGLACVMPAAMDQVDCACPAATRTKGEGDACASAAECAPGLICNQMSGSLTCRPICRCNANGSGVCTATTPNDCPTAGTTCRAVTNNTIYGICL
jgi:hypothetical protein